MCRTFHLFIFLLSFFVITAASGNYPPHTENLKLGILPPDTLRNNQMFYNGRLWKNLYYMVKEDQFLFSSAFLKGTVTINGKTYSNIRLKYDLFKDEILTPFGPGDVLQMNKEMVDSFSIYFQDNIYRFVSLPEDTDEALKGYVNVLYQGKIALYAKYIKKINRPGVENEPDRFYQLNRIYVLKNKQLYQIANKNDLFKVLKDKKNLIREYSKKNNVVIEKDMPESFVPVIRYYDSMNQ